MLNKLFLVFPKKVQFYISITIFIIVLSSIIFYISFSFIMQLIIELQTMQKKIEIEKLALVNQAILSYEKENHGSEFDFFCYVLDKLYDNRKLIIVSGLFIIICVMVYYCTDDINTLYKHYFAENSKKSSIVVTNSNYRFDGEGVFKPEGITDARLPGELVNYYQRGALKPEMVEMAKTYIEHIRQEGYYRPEILQNTMQGQSLLNYFQSTQYSYLEFSKHIWQIVKLNKQYLPFTFRGLVENVNHYQNRLPNEVWLSPEQQDLIERTFDRTDRFLREYFYARTSEGQLEYLNNLLKKRR